MGGWESSGVGLLRVFARCFVRFGGAGVVFARKSGMEVSSSHCEALRSYLYKNPNLCRRHGVSLCRKERAGARSHLERLAVSWRKGVQRERR